MTMSDPESEDTMLSKPGPPTDTDHPTGAKQAAENADEDPPA